MPRLRLGTRGSVLALAQARRVAERLRSAHPGLELEIVPVRTAGDRAPDRPLHSFAEPGVFVKELERALQAGRIDAAVHSAKDVPTSLPPGLSLEAFPERAPAWDVLVAPQPYAPDARGLPDLPRGARVATGSVRRRAQLVGWRPDLVLVGLRGNVDTRLGRLVEQGLDAIVLAAAGLARLGLLDGAGAAPPGEPRLLHRPDGPALWVHALDPAVFVPAPGQGALAVEVRAADASARELVRAIDDPAVAAALRAERAFLAAVGATCAVPVGAHAVVEGDRLVLRAYYAAAAQPYASDEGPAADAEGIGRRLAARLLSGAGSRAGS